MYFKNLVDEVNQELNIGEKDSKRTIKILNTAFEIIKAKVVEGEKVYIRNFGTFESVDRPERKGRNPQTGEEIIISANKRVKFKSSKTFKSLFNK